MLNNAAFKDMVSREKGAKRKKAGARKTGAVSVEELIREDYQRSRRQGAHESRGQKRARAEGGAAGQPPASKQVVRDGYRDRAAERREGLGDYSDEMKALAEKRVSAEMSKYLGGDEKHTHLVKGLDYALLRRTKEEMRELEREKGILEGREPQAPAGPRKDPQLGEVADGLRRWLRRLEQPGGNRGFLGERYVLSPDGGGVMSVLRGREEMERVERERRAFVLLDLPTGKERKALRNFRKNAKARAEKRKEEARERREAERRRAAALQISIFD